MTNEELIAEARRLENDYGDNYEVMTHMSALADALEAAEARVKELEAQVKDFKCEQVFRISELQELLEAEQRIAELEAKLAARQPSENDREVVANHLREIGATCMVGDPCGCADCKNASEWVNAPLAVVLDHVVPRAAVPDAATELRAERDAALVAAQGAAPQAESAPKSSYISPSLPAMIRNLWKSDPSENSVRTALKLAGDLIQELIDLKAAPVLPSSGVDEDALAEVIAQARNRWAIYGREGDPFEEFVARAVAEWLEGQGNAARE